MLRKKLRTFMISSLLLTLMAASVNARQNDIDYQRMDRDLRISQEVLKNMYAERTVKNYYEETNIKGSYLDGYGVVFLVPVSSHTASGSRAELAREAHEELVENLYDFFATYADVIKQIKPNEKISLVATPASKGSSSLYYMQDYDRLGYVSLSDVVVSVGGNERGQGVTVTRRGRSSDERFQIKPYIMSVQKSNITRYRNGDLDEAQFRKTVEFMETGDTNKEYMPQTLLKDIKVMRGILQMSVNDNFSSSISASRYQGTYIKDYGVLFTIKGHNVPVPIVLGGSGDRSFVFDTRDLEVAGGSSATVIALDELQVALDRRDTELALTERDLRSQGFKGSNAKMLDTIIASVTDALANYGHTLRGLTTNEKISVVYSSNGTRRSQRANKNLMLTVNYKDILDYSRGAINFEALKKKVSARTF